MWKRNAVLSRAVTVCAVVAALPLAGCVSAPPRAGLAAPTPIFDPFRFFAGRTAGAGELRVLFSRASAVRVEGDGRVEADGALLLTQKVRQEGRAERTRAWRLRPLGGGRFTGTLTDAMGSVAAEVRGNRLHVRFRAKGGFAVEQWLYLQPGGGVALNRMTVRKLGITVARLNETIRRVP